MNPAIWLVPSATQIFLSLPTIIIMLLWVLSEWFEGKRKKEMLLSWLGIHLSIQWNTLTLNLKMLPEFGWHFQDIYRPLSWQITYLFTIFVCLYRGLNVNPGWLDCSRLLNPESSALFELPLGHWTTHTCKLTPAGGGCEWAKWGPLKKSKLWSTR